MREFDERGQPLCPQCKTATNAAYATVPNLPCWSCGATLPEPNLPNRTQKPPKYGDGEAFLASGQTWYLSPLTPGIRKRFAQQARLLALQEIQEDKDAVEAELYRERMTIFEEQCATGVYRWGSPMDAQRAGRGVVALLSTEEGIVYLTRLLLEREHGDIEPGRVVEIMADNPEGFRVAYRGALKMDPLDRRPAPTTTENPTETPALSA